MPARIVDESTVQEAIRLVDQEGLSIRQAAERLGIRYLTLYARVKRAKERGRVDTYREVGRPKEAETITISETDNPPIAKREDVIALLERHREELRVARNRLLNALYQHAQSTTIDELKKAFERLKAAKISAETIDLIQRAERRAWGIDDEQGEKPKTVVIRRSYV